MLEGEWRDGELNGQGAGFADSVGPRLSPPMAYDADEGKELFLKGTDGSPSEPHIG